MYRTKVGQNDAGISILEYTLVSEYNIYWYQSTHTCLYTHNISFMDSIQVEVLWLFAITLWVSLGTGLAGWTIATFMRRKNKGKLL